MRVEALDPGHDELLDPAPEHLGAGRGGLKRLAEPELEVVDQPDAGRLGSRPVQGLHEGDARGPVGEDRRTVLLDLGEFVDVDHGPGDQAQVALAAEQGLLQLNARGLAGGGVALLDRARGRDQGDVLDQVLDVAVAVLLHATGVGRDPATQRGQLDAVRLVAEVSPSLPSNSSSRPPVMPAWTVAVRFARLIESTRFIRLVSTETTIRLSPAGTRRALLTFVPPP